MLRYIDSTPIFTCEAPSLTYSEHLTSQTLQATFFFEPKDFASRPPPLADRRSGQIFSSRPMSPLRSTLSRAKFFLSPAREIPWKTFSSGNFFFVRRKIDPPKKHTSDRDNFSIREGKFFPIRRPADCFLAPMSSLRYIAAFDFFLSPNAYHPRRTFSSGNSFFAPIADPACFVFFPSPPCFHSNIRFFLSPS